MSILINILLVIHVLISLLIILLVLMQRPKNEGLGAAFGGGMTDNLFGAQTTNVLQSGTRWLGGTFFVLTLLLSFLYVRNSSAKSNVQKSLSQSAVPAATPAPAGPIVPTIVKGTATAVETPAVKPGEVGNKDGGTGTPPPPALEPVKGKDASPSAPESKPAPSNPEPPKPEAPKADAPAPAPADPKPDSPAK